MALQSVINLYGILQDLMLKNCLRVNTAPSLLTTMRNFHDPLTLTKVSRIVHAPTWCSENAAEAFQKP